MRAYGLAGEFSVSIEHQAILVRSARIDNVDCNSQLIRVALPTVMPQGAQVRLRTRGQYSMEGHVLYSVACGGTNYATIRVLQDERRRHPRIQVAEDVRISSLHSQMEITNRPARITDVSEEGIGLLTDQRIPRGTLLKISLRDAIIFGEVKYHMHSSVPGQFKVGLALGTVMFCKEEERPDRPSSEQKPSTAKLLRQTIGRALQPLKILQRASRANIAIEQ